MPHALQHRLPFADATLCQRESHLIVQMTDLSCATCGVSFTETNLIPINGTAEQIENLKAALPSRKHNSKSKGGSKRKRNSQNADPP